MNPYAQSKLLKKQANEWLASALDRNPKLKGFIGGGAAGTVMGAGLGSLLGGGLSYGVDRLTGGNIASLPEHAGLWAMAGGGVGGLYGSLGGYELGKEHQALYPDGYENAQQSMMGRLPVIVDKGVRSGLPVLGIEDQGDGVLVARSEDPGKPEEAEVWSLAEVRDRASQGQAA